MELSEYLAVLTRRWWLVVVPVVVLAAAALAGSLVSGPEYRSSAVLYLSPTADPDFDTGVAAQRLNAYAALARSPRVAEGVIEALGSELSVLEVQDAVSAAADPTALLLTVDAIGSSPQHAQDIAAATALQLVALSEALEPLAADQSQSPWLVPAQEAQEGTAQSSGAVAGNVALAAVLGLLVGCVLALVVDAATSRRQTAATRR